MANVVRGLLVTVGLDAAEYTNGLTKAERQAEVALQKIRHSVTSVANTIKGLGAAFGVGIGVGAFTGMIKGAIDAQEELELVGARAGLTGEQMSALTLAARLSHTSLEDMAQMSQRLSKALIESDNATSKSSIALKALGFSSKDTARFLQDPLTAIHELAKRLNELPEGGTKAALQLLLLGRSGGITSAALNELAKQTELVATRTQTEINTAKEFNDKLVEMDIRASRLKATFANALIDPMTDVIDALAKLTTGADGAGAAISKLAADGSIKEWAQDAAIAVATIAESLLFVGKNARLLGNDLHLLVTDFQIIKGGLSGLSSVAMDPGFSESGTSEAVDNLRALFKKRRELIANEGKLEAAVWENNTRLSDGFRKQFEASAAAAASGVPAVQIGSADAFQRRLDAAARKAADIQKAIKASANAGGAEDPTRKILEAALAALKANTEQEKAVLQNREQYLQASFDRGNIALAAYYSEKQAAQDEDLRRTTVNYLEQIRLIDRFIATAKTQKDKAQGEKEKVAATSAQQLAVIQAAGRAQQLLDQQERSLREYARTLDEVNAQMLELQGNTAAAASIRFTNQQAERRRELQVVVDDPTSTQAATAAARLALDRLSQTEKMVQKQAELNEVTSKYALILGQAGIESAKIDLLAQTGAVTEIESLNRKAAIATQYVGLLKEQAEAYEKIANSPAFKGTATGNAMLLQAQQMRLAIDQLAAAAETLNNKFRDVFTSAFADNFSAFITGAKSAKDALRDFVKSVEKSIADIASKEIGETLFGKGGALGQIPEFFGKAFGGGTKGIFGGAGEATGAAALTGAGATLTASGATLAAAGISLDAAAIAITSAAGTLAAGGAASSLGGGSSFVSELFSGFGAFASGGTPPMNRASLVGERGPELFMPRSSGTIIPFDALKRGRGKSVTVNVNANFSGQMSTKSATQAGRELGLQINRAVSRS